MAESRIPPPTEAKPDLARRGEEVIRALSQVKPGGGGGGAARSAPPWVHKLVDILWDVFTR